MYKLRDYQINQLEFLKNTAPYSNVCGVESPTGSGKTITFLHFAKWWLEQPENEFSNVIISTGFNFLVFQMEEVCKKIGLNPIVLIGLGACQCPILYKEKHKTLKGFTAFSKDPICCGKKHDIVGPYGKKEKCPDTIDVFHEVKAKIANQYGNVIITNHSSLLAHKNFTTFDNANLLIVDEAHTFSSFYESSIKLELERSDFREIEKATKKLQSPIVKSIIEKSVASNRPLAEQIVTKLTECIYDNDVSSRVYEFFTTKPDVSNYITMENDCYTIDKFYRSFDFKKPDRVIAISATLDEWTQEMFGLRRANLYKEHKLFCDFSKSEFIANPEDDYISALKWFLDYVKSKGHNNGLILSTTIEDMNKALSINGYSDFKLYDDLEEFKNRNTEEVEYSALVGSRALFQGVDIPDLDFVCLNKLPFPNWDDKARARDEYLTNGGKLNYDVWRQYTIPHLCNDILQSLGRLHRNTDSKGIISIFDSRIEKFSYVISKTICNYKKGIQVNIRDMENDTIRPLFEERDKAYE